jgi:hypothetical protein
LCLFTRHGFKMSNPASCNLQHAKSCFAVTSNEKISLIRWTTIFAKKFVVIRCNFDFYQSKSLQFVVISTEKISLISRTILFCQTRSGSNPTSGESWLLHGHCSRKWRFSNKLFVLQTRKAVHCFVLHFYNAVVLAFYHRIGSWLLRFIILLAILRNWV